MFKRQEDIVQYVLTYYRDHASTLPGPKAAVNACWPGMVKRIPILLLGIMARKYLAHEVSRQATAGASFQQGWKPAHGIVQLTPVSPPGTAAPATVHVPLQQLAYTGPTVIYPRLLVETVYQTENVCKALIEFTQADFQFCIGRFVDQRNGIDRHIQAMHAGMELLQDAHVTCMKDVPTERLQTFAVQWAQALRPTTAAVA
jgi:hypothetical protein